MKTPDDFIDPRLSKKLDHLQDVPPRDPAARARGRTNFLAEVETAAASGRSAQPVQPSRWNRPIFVINMRTAAMALGLLLGLTVLLAFGGSAVTAYAQTALPGDFLYGLKSASEDARVTLSADAGAVAELHLQFAERRIDEIRGLINQGRYENIALAAREYESHIYQALGAVGLLAADDPARAEAITVTIFNSLADYTAALVVLRETVPVGQPQTALEKAVNASRFQYSDDNLEFTGQVEAMGANRWIIGGRVVIITPDTEIDGLLAVGDLASVHARVDRDGSLIAREIEPVSEGEDESPEADVEFAGVVERITPDQWTVDSQLVTITPATEIEGNIIVGNLVKVEGYLDENGSLIAQEIALVEDGPEDNSNEDGDDEHSDNGSPEGTENGGEDGEEDDEEPSTNEGSGDEGGSSGEDNDSGDDGDDPGSNEGDDNPGGDDPDENENEGDNDEDSPDDEDPPDDDDPPDNEDPPDEEDPPDNGD